MRMQFLNDGIAEWLKTSRKGIPTELVPWEFHHYINFATGAVGTEQTFFNVAAGQVTSGGVVVTKEDCNLFKASSIGYPYKFLVQEVGFQVESLYSAVNGAVEKLAEADILKSISNDLDLVLRRGVASFETLQKSYFELAPMTQMPAGIGQTGASALAGSLAAPGAYVAHMVANGWPVKSNRFHTEIPLDEETQFNMYLRYPKGAVTLASAGVRMGFILAGILQRPKV